MSDSDTIDRIAALEARIRALEDERSIRELLAVYGFHADTKRDEEYLDLWTDDGVMDLVGSIDAHQGGPMPGRMIWEGRDRLREFITDPDSHHKPGFYGKTLHTQGNNVVVRVDGDEATVNSYSIVLQEIDGKTTLITAGANRWRLRRENGRWRIQERRRREVGEDDIPELLSATSVPEDAS